MLSALVLLTFCSAAITSGQANTIEIFDQIQELLRTKRSVLGELDYVCYEGAGECVAEYKMDGLVTYKEEALCSSSEEGCGEGTMVLERATREAMCVNMDEGICKRSADQLCPSAVLEKMEEMACAELLAERRVRKKRDECLALRKRFQTFCSGRKRAITDECWAVMESMDSSECAGEVEFLSKRATSCEDGWTLRKGICYKYFKSPLNFAKASKVCAGAIKGKDTSQLATIESMLVKTSEDRKFFGDLIKGSGALEHIDSVLATMDDMFEGKNWKEVITYYDNWSWIGVKNSGEENEKKWKWAVANKNEKDWNEVKVGQDDFRKGEPSQDHDLRMDNGACVVYFYNKKPIDSSLSADVEEVGEVRAWWNANCNLELPFLCEVRAD